VSQKSIFILNKNKSSMPSTKYFVKNQKCLTKCLNKFFDLGGLQMSFSMCFFWFNVSATHIFNKQIFSAAEKAPPPPFTTMMWREWGNVGSFQPQALALVLKQ
jgi:hypothetical protein